MIEQSVSCIVLAAGLGKRMNSNIPKPLHQICGKTILARVLQALNHIKPSSTVVVAGHKRELVETEVEKLVHGATLKYLIHCAVQENQLGTGDAVASGLKKIPGFKGDILILPGDMPLISSRTLEDFISAHQNAKSELSCLSFRTINPTGYGRIVRKNKVFAKIVEEKDCNQEERSINEVNSSIFLVAASKLKQLIANLKPNNKQGELYLTDIVSIFIDQGGTPFAFPTDSNEELEGANDRIELSNLETKLRKKTINRLMLEGVRFIDPTNAYIDEEVLIGRDSTIGPNTQIFGATNIGENVMFEGSSIIIDSSIDSDCKILLGSHIQGSQIGEKCEVGPFARLRDSVQLAEGVIVGNFVEVKKSSFGKNSKAKHLSYLGDTTLGEGVNIGCGTVTANYDGVNKHKTVIASGASTGSNSTLIAPVTIGKDAYIAGGSTINKDVPEASLAIGRSAQRVIEGWNSKNKTSSTK